MMDVITGKTRPDSGRVIFNNTDLIRLDEAGIANLGIGRKFQRPTVFENHSVRNNLALALKAERSPLASLFWRTDEHSNDLVETTLQRVGLGALSSLPAGGLSHGQKQWLEIGMLLMQDPDLLLIDEPVAGMTDAETEKTAEMLIHIAGTRSVIVVEHDMNFVRTLNVRVTVLHEGSVLAEGSLDSVQNNQRVIDVYLGR
jgi:urea transport system ATP-binding protein